MATRTAPRIPLNVKIIINLKSILYRGDVIHFRSQKNDILENLRKCFEFTHMKIIKYGIKTFQISFH